MKGVMRWHILALVSLIWFALSMLTAYDAQESVDGRYALPLILMFQAVLLLFASIIVFKANTDKVKVAWPSLDWGGDLIFIGFTIIYLTILTRLLCFTHFGGSVGSFSFGLKCDGNECKENEAFSLSFNSFGHAIQGALSFFLFSDILIGGLKDRWRKGANWELKQTLLLHMKEIVGVSTCFYPIYNILKRAIKSADTFSRSSFWNNASEWACGFALATCAIYCYYAIIYYTVPAGRDIKQLTKRFDKLELLREGTQYLPRVRIVAGIALILVALLSIILLVTTWNSEGQSEADDSEDFLTIILLIILLLMILGLVALFKSSSPGRGRGSTVRLTHEEFSKPSPRNVKSDSNVRLYEQPFSGQVLELEEKIHPL